MTLRLLTLALIGGVLFLAGMCIGGTAVKSMMLEWHKANTPVPSPIVTTIPVRNRWGRTVFCYTVVRVQTPSGEETWVLKSKEGR